MTIAEFIEVQQLAPADLRTRFGLSPSCDPSMTALTTDPRREPRNRRRRLAGRAGGDVSASGSVRRAPTAPVGACFGQEAARMETILVVDDESELIAIARDMLETERAQVHRPELRFCPRLAIHLDDLLPVGERDGQREGVVAPLRRVDGRDVLPP